MILIASSTPIFSLGLLFASKEVQCAAEAIRDHLGGKDCDAANPFAGYEYCAERAQDVIQALIECLWNFPLLFDGTLPLYFMR